MARDDDRCLNDDIQRVRERMVDDHNELKGEHQSILSAIQTGFRDATIHLDKTRPGTDSLSNFNIYWKLGAAAAAAIAVLLKLGLD